MLKNIFTDNVSKYAGYVRHAIGIIGGGLVEFGVATNMDVTVVTDNFDKIVTGLSAVVDNAYGIFGAVMSIVAVVASHASKSAAK